MAEGREGKVFNKVTYGFVVQKYLRHRNGVARCVSQEFIAGDEVDYETLDETVLRENDVEPCEYYPFNMEQPENKKEK